MRLIDADELIVMEYGGIKFVPKEFIDDAPTVDATEVIRCKYCKHRDPEDKKCDLGCDIVWQLPRKDDFYCAYAERREE